MLFYERGEVAKWKNKTGKFSLLDCYKHVSSAISINVKFSYLQKFTFKIFHFPLAKIWYNWISYHVEHIAIGIDNQLNDIERH